MKKESSPASKRAFYPILVGNIGKKSHLTSSLDCNGKLSLVKSAVAAYTSGEDLSSLGNELSELCYVLVIDLGDLVLAEDANLLSSVVRTEAAALCIVSFHRKSSTFLAHDFCIARAAVSQAERGRACLLEGKTLVAGNFFKIVVLRIVVRRSAVCRRSVALLAGSFILGAAVLRSGTCEADFVSNYVGRISLLTLIVGPGPCLDLSANEDGIALLKIAGDKLSLLSPSNDVDEVNAGLILLVLGTATVNGDREATHRNT